MQTVGDFIEHIGHVGSEIVNIFGHYSARRVIEAADTCSNHLVEYGHGDHSRLKFTISCICGCLYAQLENGIRYRNNLCMECHMGTRICPFSLDRYDFMACDIKSMTDLFCKPCFSDELYSIEQPKLAFVWHNKHDS